MEQRPNSDVREDQMRIGVRHLVDIEKIWRPGSNAHHKLSLISGSPESAVFGAIAFSRLVNQACGKWWGHSVFEYSDTLRIA